MSNRELREWLGLTLADLLVYLAIAAVIAMYLIRDSSLDMGLAAIGVILALASCPLGMKRDPEVSDLTNVLKFVSYPIIVLMMVAAIAAHYAWFREVTFFEWLYRDR